MVSVRCLAQTGEISGQTGTAFQGELLLACNPVFSGADFRLLALSPHAAHSLSSPILPVGRQLIPDQRRSAEIRRSPYAYVQRAGT